MPNINITVAGKIATNMSPGVVIVCGNSDYTVTFNFDKEWNALSLKTARFTYVKGGRLTYTEVPFVGKEVAMPVMSDITDVFVGVYAGDLHTTTPARVWTKRSILCGLGPHKDPAEDIYLQLISLLNEIGGVPGPAGPAGIHIGSEPPTDSDIMAWIDTDGVATNHFQLKPEFANSVAECTDTSKLYVLPDGYIYAYFGGETETPDAAHDTTLTITDGVRIDTSAGTESTSSYYAASDYIEVADGYTYTLTRTAGTDHMYFSCKACYYDASKNYISASGIVIDQSTDDTEVTATVPIISNAAYFRLRIYSDKGKTAVGVFTLTASSGSSTAESGWCSTGHAFVPADYEERIVALEDTVEDLEATVDTVESICSALVGGVPDTTLTITEGTTLDKSTGVESSAAYYAVSNYIPIVDGFTYEITKAAGKPAYVMSVGVGYYDSDRNYLSGEYRDSVIAASTTVTSSETTATIPSVSGAKYFRLRIYTEGCATTGIFTLSTKYTGASSGTGSGSDVPDYVVTEANRVISEVMQKQTNRTITFLAISDMHNWENSATIRNGNLHAGQAAKIIADSIGLDFAAMLGDIVWGAPISTYPDQSIDDVLKANQYIADAFRGVDNFRTNGNHDPLTVLEEGANGNLTQGQMYALIGRYNGSGKSYFYRDYEDKKVRVIMLNTVDENNSGGAGMTAAQLLWFAQSLDLSGKSDTSDWQILILSHHPLDWDQYSWGTNLMNAANILAAYLEGSSISFTEEGVTNSYNFSGKNGATIIGQIHGHLHNYKVDNIYSTLSGTIEPTTVKRIAIPNACYYRSNEYADASNESLNGIDYGDFQSDGTTPLTYSKTAGTAEDTAFCVVTIDLDEKKIYADHYGAGYDREISYA